MTKHETISKVIEDTMALYGVEREGAYPYVIGMATAFLTEEQVNAMLDSIAYLTTISKANKGGM
jgi:hypothetical protein